MSETFMRHFIAAIGMIICGLAYAAGYFAGQNGWWLAAITVVAVYPIIYSLLGGGH